MILINTALNRYQGFFTNIGQRLLIFLSVFGPATITAMAGNDASGIATYSIAGATLGYPILFLLVIITVLLAITQEMGMRPISDYGVRFGIYDQLDPVLAMSLGARMWNGSVSPAMR